MLEPKADPESPERADSLPANPDPRAPSQSAQSKSMHDGVEVWCDCCSCEAEPYWLEAFAGESAP